MQLLMPEDVRFIIEKLQGEGYEAYAVGGCVRDSYLGLTPHDWDITTNALPQQVKALFRRTIDIGIQHGTVKIMLGDEGYEVTTYRIDGEYEDSRHPKEVIFTAELKEDLRRRDFTINAMAYSEKTGIIDLFGGIEDLKAGIIRAVGNPKERFTEDALRILRALRFSARFGYEIEENTKEAIRELAPTLSKISAERIREELEKLILSDNPDRLVWAYNLGVTKVILPEWDEMMECPQNTPYHIYNVGIHTLKLLEDLACNYDDISDEDMRILRIAALFHDVSKPEARTTDGDNVDHFKGHPEKGAIKVKEILRRLKYDNDTIDKVSTLVRYHDERPALTYPNVRRLLVKVNPENAEKLIIIKEVDFRAHSDYLLQKRHDEIEGLKKIIHEILSNGDCLAIKDMDISGKDLIKAGIPAGPLLGEKLKDLFEMVLDDPNCNTYSYLIEHI